MADPTVTDVVAYSQGRLEEDARTTALLAGSLAAARTYCGWHVIGEKTESITVNGPGTNLLVLPTTRLAEITALSELGTALDLTRIEWSTRGHVMKAGRSCWTSRLRGITATIKHGYEDAPDFNAAVLAIVDRIGCGGDGESVGPFKFPTLPHAVGSMFSDMEKAILDAYRLEPAP